MAIGIGTRIRMRRLELGITQSELANKMGYKSKAAICKVETGDDNLTTDRVKLFAEALDCTPSFLMGWEDKDVIEVKSDFFYTGKILGEEKAAIIELVKSMDDQQIDKLIQLLKLMYPELELR